MWGCKYFTIFGTTRVQRCHSFFFKKKKENILSLPWITIHSLYWLCIKSHHLSWNNTHWEEFNNPTPYVFIIVLKRCIHRNKLILIRGILIFTCSYYRRDSYRKINSSIEDRAIFKFNISWLTDLHINTSPDKHQGLPLGTIYDHKWVRMSTNNQIVSTVIQG